MDHVWFHDGTGYGWPTKVTARREITEEASEEVEAPVGVETEPGVFEQRMGIVTRMLGHTITTVTRDMIVYYTGPEDNPVGLVQGVNVRINVPEGAPSEPGTCSHIQWQPGTESHAAAVTYGIAENAARLQADKEQLQKALELTEKALDAAQTQMEQLVTDHVLEPPTPS